LCLCYFSIAGAVVVLVAKSGISSERDKKKEGERGVEEEKVN